MCADRVRQRNKGSQGHEFNSNTLIEQSVNHKVNEAPTLILPRVKEISLGSYITIVHLCA